MFTDGTWLEVKRIRCSSKGSRFLPQYLYGSSKLPVLPVCARVQTVHSNMAIIPASTSLKKFDSPNPKAISRQ